ncbi:PREDICTED: zinc transporter 7-like [Amphimedon queenslandica]|nr:PREDICTED: zinc transporter 7-like [Amphimedon queenslandica]|eukprot:XP_011405352.2 PREDICTED: zinc transporter 7-like [Amphimedon queenslandica]
MQADPICSMFIAILITLSVYPLMQKSLESLMQRFPRELNVTLPHLTHKINEINSVTHVLKCHVWTLCTNVHVANARVEVYPGSDLNQIHAEIKTILNEAGIQETYVELVQSD